MTSGLDVYGTNYTKRAVVAAYGWPANLEKDAIYPYTEPRRYPDPLRRGCLWLKGGVVPLTTDALSSESNFRSRCYQTSNYRRRIMKRRTVVAFASLYAGVVLSTTMLGGSPAVAATPPKPAISEDARSALAQMGTALLAKEFSFHAHTIRVYESQGKEQLHIVHNFEATVRRPDRLLVAGTGDDGPRKLTYDGSNVVFALGDGKTYATLPVPNTIQQMMYVVMGRFGVDFPLADFLTEAPDKAFLTGVTAGREVNAVTIDGVPCRHLVFSQPPGIELELWLEKDRGMPRRLIVIDNALPGSPNFVVEMSNWNFGVHPADADFTFTPPEDAKQVDFGVVTGELHTGG
jgi:hypothetical protein